MDVGERRGRREKKKTQYTGLQVETGVKWQLGTNDGLMSKRAQSFLKSSFRRDVLFFCLILFFARLEAKRFKQTKKKHKHLICRFITGQYSGNIIKMPLNFKGEQINFNTQL